MLGFEEDRRTILERIAPLTAEQAELLDSLGRVLAEDVIAPRDLPSFDNSAMDGYAVRAAHCASAQDFQAFAGNLEPDGATSYRQKASRARKKGKTMKLGRSIRPCIFLLAIVLLSSAVFAQVVISVNFGPPALPVYEQPLCPGDGFIWTPGYWAWDTDAGSYYWVPGTWVEAPEVGYLWTPPWWGWEGGFYVFHPGWWGPHVGFYGGINYGHGYFGNGYWGGRWQEGHFFYNREVTNINVVNVRNVYNEHVTIVNNSRVAFNGGSGGIQARPMPQEEQWARERRIGPLPAQTQHIEAARSNPELRASVNRGKPPIAATERPGNFRGTVVPARAAGGEYRPEEHEMRPGAAATPTRPPAPTHAKDIPPYQKLTPPSTGDAKLDRQYQKEQQKLQSQQQKEIQQLQKQQEKEHAQLARQNAGQERQQQLEQQHQQQTQQLVQRHTEQRQQIMTRQSAPKEERH